MQIHFLVFIKALLVSLIMLLNNPSKLLAEDCVLASDYGYGGTIIVYANPNQDSSGSTYQDIDPSSGKPIKTKLLKAFPKNQQIAPWVDSGFYTTGIANNSKNKAYSVLKGYIQGSWYPWGSNTNKKCELVPCSKTISSNAICLSDGKIVKSDPKDSTMYAQSSPDIISHPFPCMLDQGKGLYGLISINNNGTMLDPNDLSKSAALPAAYFRTFHAIASEEQNSDNDVSYFQINYTQLCGNNSDGTTVCTTDKQYDGIDYVVKGRLYFKILDRYYEDNTGEYAITLVSGVYGNEGFIQEAINTFTDAITQATKTIYTTLTHDLNFLNICKAMLVLYVAFTGVGFMLGLVKIEKKELIIRLIKVGIVATLISEYSWNFFNTYLFTLLLNIANGISEIIVTSTLYSDNNLNQPIFLMPEGGSPVSIFDEFLKVMIAVPIHKKICSLLFYDWKLYYIPAIYVCWYFIMLGIIRAVFLYILAIMQFALLMVCAPIFIIMILFQYTKHLFDEWIKMMINSAFLMMLVVSTFALMMNIIVQQLQTLLYYQVCWTTVWEITLGPLDLLNMPFWSPTNSSQANAALSIGNLFAFLIVSLVFTGILEKVPELADTLSASSRQTSGATAGGFIGALQGSFLGQAMDMVKSLNPVGIALKQVQRVPIVGQVASVGEKIIQNPNKVQQVMDKYMKPGNDGKIGADASTNLMPDVKNAKQSFEQGYQQGKASSKQE